MTEIETLRNFINENLETIKNGTREDAIELLRNYCEKHNVLDHDAAHANHYFAISESGDEVVDADPISYMNQAGCPGTDEKLRLNYVLIGMYLVKKRVPGGKKYWILEFIREQDGIFGK